jgi:thiamine-phosphate pyrophosphorylase
MLMSLPMPPSLSSLGAAVIAAFSPQSQPITPPSHIAEDLALVPPPASPLYLIAYPAPGLDARLRALLGGGAVSTLLVTPAAGTKLDRAEVAPLVTLAQGLGVAALIAEDVDLAKAVGADGVHLGGNEEYAAARSALGREAIVGVTAASRHVAMIAGESGADYIAFAVGQPAMAGAAEDDPVGSDAASLITWWSEIFEVPCVGFGAVDAESAAGLFAAGADFVAVPLPSRATPKADDRWLAAMREALSAAAAEPGR